ncbi:MAG: phenylalanine--tRNA ligase subunit beta [Candidatus Diapherotrites archaeon]
MVNVDTTLEQINGYMRKPLTINQLRDSLSRLGFDLESDDPNALKIDITAERPDMISPAGIARVLNAYLGYTQGFSSLHVKEGNYHIHVDSSVLPVRPYTAAFVVRNIHLTQEKLDELIWVQEKLHETFARQRKKGAIGIYPLNKIKWPITFTGEHPEKIVFPPLGSEKPLSGLAILHEHPTGKKYAPLLHNMPIFPVFRDAKKEVLSMPPIINSQHVGAVSIDDQDLFVEVSGHYWPTLSILTDILAHVFADMKGDIYSVQVHFPNETTPRITPELKMDSLPLEISLVNRTLGTVFTSEQTASLLTRMGYTITKQNSSQLVVSFPQFRADVLHPLDIVDDVARAYGFDNLQPIPVELYTQGGVLPQTQLNDDIRSCITGLGFHEVMSWHLTSHEHHFTTFEREHSPHVRLGVVKEQSLTMVRNMLYPETLRALLSNRSATQPFKLFELDQIVDIHENTDTGTITHYKLCLILGHAAASFTEMKSYVDALSRFLGEKPVFTETKLSGFIDGRTAHVKMGKFNGFLGETHPRVLARLGIPFPLVVFECYLSEG